MKKIIIISIITVILVIFLFPKNISTCGGDILCFGQVVTETSESTWLNVKDSIVEVRQKESQLCIGFG